MYERERVKTETIAVTVPQILLSIEGSDTCVVIM